MTAVPSEPTPPAPPGWTVRTSHGPAAAFHAVDLAVGTGREVWVHSVDRPTIVLGSTQRPEEVDTAAADAAGLAVARRRSGGGAVLVEPGGALWVDVVVPPGDPLWDDDVGRAAHWVGRAWATALTACGVAEVAVHTGPLVTTPWSARVCFAGLGPGEVTAAGRKVVGVSQRRTRAGARFQTMALAVWAPGPLLAGLRMTEAERVEAARDLADVAAGVPVAPVTLLAAFLTALPGPPTPRA